ncbi:MAG: protein translocase subunit SecF [Acidobacteriota bacterium]|nr:protein translocase subunit SecF [Acidobacteriota bacterium]
MIRILENVNIDWLSKRRLFLTISAALLLAGLASALSRQLTNRAPFNLGVDFRGGTVVTVRFPKERPTDQAIRAALSRVGVGDAIVQPVLDNQDLFLIKVAQQGSAEEAQGQAQVDIGRTKITEALSTFGREPDDWSIEQTEAVGAVAGSQLRNQAITVTLLALVGILLYIAFRFEWTYGAAAVITVFHDVLVTLSFFSIFQWEINLTVIAALLTLVGFSVNDTIVTFDRIRENLRLHRRESLYKITNDAINQTLSRTIITGGLVFLSVLALVVFGGQVLRGFSLALFVGIIVGTYSTIAIASPIMVWWQKRLDSTGAQPLPAKDGVARGRTAPGVRRSSKAGAATAR